MNYLPPTSGLCVSCSRQMRCMYRPKDGEKHSCEEFETGDEAAGWPLLPAPAPAPASTLTVREAQLGLCSTCTHRETCRLRPAEGGVWHCEEFA